MTTDKDELLQQARDSLAAAKLLLANGYAGYSAARSYYTIFYVKDITTPFPLQK
ncbi:MAG: hypothetical protein ACOYN8_10410 [Pseudanabaena sp.]|jgi:uncharacterized protein (UPF0332 family)